MIKVKVGTNVDKQTIIIEEETTLLGAIEEAGFNPNVGAWMLNSASIGPGELQKSFADFGISDGRIALLLNVAKPNNAR